MPSTPPPPSRRQAVLGCVMAVVVVLVTAGVLLAAVLVPAPTVVLPLVVIACIGCPMLAAWELRDSIAGLRREPRAVAKLRRSLDRLPETRHPLGL